MRVVSVTVAAATLCAAGCITPGSIDNAMHRMGDRAVNDAANTSYDKARKGVTEGGSNQGQAQQTQQAQAGGGQAQAGAGEPDAAPAPAEIAAGDVYSPRFDFVPGDKVLFFDDFGDTPASDYPSRWKKSAGGHAEVVDYQGRHWLRQIADGRSMHSVENYLRVDLKKALPKKLTIEFDVPRTATVGVSLSREYWATGQPSIWISPGTVNSGYYSHWAKVRFTESGTAAIRHVSIALSGSNGKIYSDGERVQLNPEVYEEETYVIRTIGILFPDGAKEQDRMFTNFKVAEGGKDYAKELTTLGRIVTHGITFDSGSDVLRPESGPTLRSVQKMLAEDADLRFEIQGHTDSQGGDKANVPLSQKRAAAVKAWLVKQGIAEVRLTTSGLGASKPIDSNDTAEGRANNRRVEFVKVTGAAGTS